MDVNKSLLRIFFVFFVLGSTVTVALAMEISSVGGDQKLGRKVGIFGQRSDVAVLNEKDNGLLKVRQLRTSENAPPSPQGNNQRDTPSIPTSSTTPPSAN